MEHTSIPNCLILDSLEESELYSEELQINLPSRRDEEIFKWFLASILFGKRISETVAKRTYRTFAKYDLLEPKKILEAGWMFLVNPVMKEGGYVRYDEKTSSQLLKDCTKLLEEYDSSLNRLHDTSANELDLEERIQDFYGVGPITCNIFLREMRPYWHHCDPRPLPMVKTLAKRYKINLAGYDRKSLKYVRLESGLIRKRKEL